MNSDTAEQGNNMVAAGDDSFVQVASKVTKGVGFDGFGDPDAQEDEEADDEVDAGEPNAPPMDSDTPEGDNNMVAAGDDSFVQMASKATKGVGFDGFGDPDAQDDEEADEEVNAGEPNAPPMDSDTPGGDDNMVAAGDDSFAQVASKVTKGVGFDGFGDPDAQDDEEADDEVDAGEPNAPPMDSDTPEREDN